MLRYGEFILGRMCPLPQTERHYLNLYVSKMWNKDGGLDKVTFRRVFFSPKTPFGGKLAFCGKSLSSAEEFLP